MPSQVDDERFLHRGWEWLEENADHDPRPENYDALDAEWYRRLHLYEEAYRLVNEAVSRQSPVAATSPSDLLPRGLVGGSSGFAGEHHQSSF